MITLSVSGFVMARSRGSGVPRDCSAVMGMFRSTGSLHTESTGRNPLGALRPCAMCSSGCCSQCQNLYALGDSSVVPGWIARKRFFPSRAANNVNRCATSDSGIRVLKSEKKKFEEDPYLHNSNVMQGGFVLDWPAPVGCWSCADGL